MPDASPSYLELPVQTRAADVRPGSWDEATRTVEVIASTGAMVRRYGFMSEYDEEIPVTEQVFDLARFLTVGPVLDNHNSYGSALNAIGRVAAAQIENRQLIATLQFDTDPTSDAIFQKMGRGILRAVSLGYDADYERVRAKDREDGGTVDLYRATRVTPYEVSVVMMPADAGAVVRGQQTGATRRYAVRDATPPASAEPTQETPAQPEERAMPTPENAGGAAALTAEQTRDIARKAQAEGFKRLADTQALLRTHTLDEAQAPDLVQRFESDIELRAEVLHLLAERDRKAPKIDHPQPPAFEPGEDGLDKTARAMGEAIMHRAMGNADDSKVRAWKKRMADDGRSAEIPKAPTDDTVKRMARTRLIDLADAYLVARGVRTAGMSIGRIAELALTMRSGGGLGTTSDFPGLLANTANKLLEIGYAESPSPRRQFARRVDRPDFKEFSIVRRSGAPRLTKVNEHGEIKRAGFNEGPTLTGQLQTAGVSVGFTRQMLINDDLDSFAQTTLGLGDSAVAYEDDLAVMDILYGNPTLEDGTVLFHSSRGNLSTDVGTPDLDAIKFAAKMFAAMGETVQTAGTNAGTTTRKIQFSLVGFYGAIGEMMTIDQIISAPRYPDAPSNAVPRTLAGLQTLRDDRLQIEAASPDVHFAFSNRPALVWGGLEGDPRPRLSMGYEASVDGAVWQLIHDTYVAVSDPKAIIRIPKS